MKLDTIAFRQLRSLAPILDDILGTGEIEHVHHAASLAALAILCGELFHKYHKLDLEHRGSTCTRGSSVDLGIGRKLTLGTQAQKALE